MMACWLVVDWSLLKFQRPQKMKIKNLLDWNEYLYRFVTAAMIVETGRTNLGTFAVLTSALFTTTTRTRTTTRMMTRRTRRTKLEGAASRSASTYPWGTCVPAKKDTSSSETKLVTVSHNFLYVCHNLFICMSQSNKRYATIFNSATFL
jgi:hypothetical protein